MNQTAKDTSMTDEDVIAFLKSNPKFLQKNPDALDYLIPPKDKSGGKGVVDFNHYMLEKLKADKQMVLNTTRDIIEVSRENMNNLARIHSAVLAVLETASFDDFIQTLSTDVPVILDCDAVSLIIEAEDDKSIPQSDSRLVRVVPKGTIEQWMGGNAARIQSNIRGAEAVFGESAGLVQSQALIRIDQTSKIPPAILAFGSRDPEMFTDAQGTELIAFLCQCVERVLKIWMV